MLWYMTLTKTCRHRKYRVPGDSKNKMNVNEDIWGRLDVVVIWEVGEEVLELDSSIHQHCRNQCLHAQCWALDDCHRHTRRNCQTDNLAPRLLVTGPVGTVADILEVVSTTCYLVVNDWKSYGWATEVAKDNAIDCSGDEGAHGGYEIVLEERRKDTAGCSSRVMM
jgi:hypothetical protein